MRPNVSAPQGSLKTLAARFATTPADRREREVGADPVHGATPRRPASRRADPALARALGTSFTLTAAGTANDGVADVQNARLTTPTADIAFTGRIGEPELHGRLTVHAGDLSPLRRSRRAEARRRRSIFRPPSTACPRTAISKPCSTAAPTSSPPASPPSTASPAAGSTLTGSIRKLPHGGYGFGNLRLVGRHASARADGEATTDSAGINVQFAIPELKYADKRLTGAASGKLRLTGSVTKPDATVNITMANGSALGRPIPRLTLTATATDLTGQLAAKAKLSGSVGGKPAQGALDLAKRAQGGWQLNDLDLRVGSVAAKGALTLDADNLAAGRLTIDAARSRRHLAAGPHQAVGRAARRHDPERRQRRAERHAVGASARHQDRRVDASTGSTPTCE